MRKDVKEKVPTMMPNKSLDIHRKTGFLNIQSLHQRMMLGCIANVDLVKINLMLISKTLSKLSCIFPVRELKTNDSPSLLYSKTNLDV